MNWADGVSAPTGSDSKVNNPGHFGQAVVGGLTTLYSQRIAFGAPATSTQYEYHRD